MQLQLGSLVVLVVHYLLALNIVFLTHCTLYQVGVCVCVNVFAFVE